MFPVRLSAIGLRVFLLRTFTVEHTKLVWMGGGYHQISECVPRVLCPYWCLHCSATGGIRPSLVQTSVNFDQRSLFGESPDDPTHGVPLRSALLTTLMWPSRMPLLGSSEKTQKRPQGELRTQPFSMTKFRARTVSSIGTNRASFTNIAMADAWVLTTFIGPMGEYNVHVVELQTMQRLLGTFDEAEYSQTTIQNTS